MLSDRRHPGFRNFDSVVFIDVIGMKSYLDSLFDPKQTVEDGGRQSKCCNCQSDCFSIYSGYKICDSCGCLNGHVLGYYDKKDYFRLRYRKKSIHQRKYHYEKKVNQVLKYYS